MGQIVTQLQTAQTTINSKYDVVIENKKIATTRHINEINVKSIVIKVRCVGIKYIKVCIFKPVMGVLVTHEFVDPEFSRTYSVGRIQYEISNNIKLIKVECIAINKTKYKVLTIRDGVSQYIIIKNAKVNNIINKKVLNLNKVFNKLPCQSIALLSLIYFSFRFHFFSCLSSFESFPFSASLLGILVKINQIHYLSNKSICSLLNHF